MRKRAAVVVMAAMAVAIGASAARSGEPEAKSAGIDPQELQRRVQEEVQRQLPKAVAVEVHSQLMMLAQQAQAEGRVNSARSTLQTLRSQLELFKIQHKDKFPSLKGLTEWQALMVSTDADGHSFKGAEFGPYLANIPVNPFTGRSRVAAAGSASVLAGWTWDESKGVLRIILPQEHLRFAPHLGKDDYEVATDKVDAAIAGPANAILSDLQMVNSQLVLYQIQHGDKSPALSEMKDWSILLQKTDAKGNIGEKLPFGPYLRAAVVNPVNHRSEVMASGAAVAEAGWTYDAAKGVVRAIIPAEKGEEFAKYLPAGSFELAK